ncbi:Multimeric flavodoxin WrbA [Paramagnetospirillum magnetotacticum MS-1]|uniref:Multimeric flavodoxin WrbA n=1 Tax=Paramagnetospirillum magnetotacticum MS-1 TaxID=272627 RepID=A0A0C2YIU9_PARME|nr:flavodoxin family protein [Paramagnetospirillum magnetotacticum]KIL99654.1 Multimeric flavodoxin WrbA [Paramagnetospirillum magnetotacticum MS-1]
MTSIAIVFHSGYGHTKVVAEAVAAGAALVAGTQVHLVAAEEAEAKADLLNGADAIIFGSPTYMGAVLAKFKEFMEWSSKTWYGRGWIDKLAAGFTVSASQNGDKLAVLQQLSVFAAQHGMIWVGLDLLPGNNNSKGSVEDLNRLGSFLGAMAQANADQGPEGVTNADKKTATHLGKRVAEAAARWKK